MTNKSDIILILDFGSQYTQLIARRVRELNVYCEIIPFNTPIEKIKAKNPKGIILSGGPASVYEKDAPHCDAQVLKLDIPILGICYGFQLLAYFLGGKVEASKQREYGAAEIIINERDTKLFANLPNHLQVWMSHGDYVSQLPTSFKAIAQTENALGAAIDLEHNYYALQFHPEVVHTPQGKQILGNFLDICNCHRDWTMNAFIDETVAKIKAQVGDRHVICGLSGGVDSSVAAALVDRAIGSQLTCLFIDNGLLRKNEFTEVLNLYKENVHLNVIGVAAGERFLSQLEGIIDPELKRKRIGNEFIEVFQEEANKLGKIDFLVQGTLYPDVIESVSVKGPSAVIKSHHNVGGLPEKMSLKLIEPLRELFKDEVRQLGRELGLPDEIINRQPFPGPGLAVRILGEITVDRVTTLQSADAIVMEEIRRANLYDEIWQAFGVLLPIQTVGVMGDSRTYENAIAIRAVHSQDGMTADWVRMPYDVLHRISSRIISEVTGINRVVYDISSKPPSTIEWE
ncbi:MAG: glutamine-hydrolyzing GMP synthase [Blastocatellia bacterium]